MQRPQCLQLLLSTSYRFFIGSSQWDGVSLFPFKPACLPSKPPFQGAMSKEYSPRTSTPRNRTQTYLSRDGLDLQLVLTRPFVDDPGFSDMGDMVSHPQ